LLLHQLDYLLKISLLQTIMKAECLSLVGADMFKVVHLQKNGCQMSLNKHTLPNPAGPNDAPRYGFNNQLLYIPIWSLTVNHESNKDFINAAVKAVHNVKVSGLLFFGWHL
jgi:hypothetical protein